MGFCGGPSPQKPKPGPYTRGQNNPFQSEQKDTFLAVALLRCGIPQAVEDFAIGPFIAAPDVEDSAVTVFLS